MANCRVCDKKLVVQFADLGSTPLANSFLKAENLSLEEKVYPLIPYVCSSCFLVQLEEFETQENIFSEYAYQSSISSSWLTHAENFCNEAIHRFQFSPRSKVIEIGSNDGYLLQFFKKRGIPVLGVEPAANIAKIANEKGINTVVEFLSSESGTSLAEKGHQADLLVANNVLAHVPNLKSFIKGMKALLKPEGTITIEFPHLVQLVANNQFDTIYHEHFSYYSLLSAEKALSGSELQVVDVQSLKTHGGSLRIFVKHKDSATEISSSVLELRAEEKRLGLNKLDYYSKFYGQVQESKSEIKKFLRELKESGKSIVGYGAPAKGNTLLNFCGIGRDVLKYVVDKNPQKQGLFLPGTKIPIFSPDKFFETKPDLILILPWNLRDEVVNDFAAVRSWGAKFIVLIPHPEILP